MLELFLVELGRIFLETLPNNIWWCRWCRCWCRCCLTIYFKVFWPRDPTIFCYSPVFSHSNYPSHRALGRYRHTFSSRQFRNIFCWLEINYCPDGGNGNCHCSISFPKATSPMCEAQLSFAAHQKYILWFFSLWWMIKGIWALFSLLFIFLWNKKPCLDNFMSIITLEGSKCEYEWGYTSDIFYSHRDIFTLVSMHLADAFIQRNLKHIQFIYFFVSLCVPWELKPQPLHC